MSRPILRAGVSCWVGLGTPAYKIQQGARQRTAVDFTVFVMQKRYALTISLAFYEESGGGEIRTHETLASLPVFKTGAFNRSATPPKKVISDR